MKNILDFLLKVGGLKNVKRTGVSFYGVKNTDSAADHSFRMALMVWVLGKGRDIKLERAIKMALIHELCKVRTGDITPYDGLIPRWGKKKKEFVRKWRRLPLAEKEKRKNHKLEKELAALKELTSDLPLQLREEFYNVWLDYEKGKSKEAKFVSQLNVTENLVEAFEQWLKDKKFPTQPWWEHADEVIDDAVLLNLLKEIEAEELKSKKE